MTSRSFLSPTFCFLPSILLTIFLLFTSNALAITIDDFSDSQSVDALAPSQISLDNIAGTQLVGGTRSITVQTTAGTGRLTVETVPTTPSRFQHSHDNSVVGASTIHWDGDLDPNTLNPVGLGGVDITEGDGTAVILSQLSIDANPASITLTMYDASDNSGNTFSSVTRDFNQAAPFQAITFQDITFLFTDFTQTGPNGGADFTNIGAIELKIDGGDSVDLSFEKIVTNGRCPLVPTAGSSVFDDCGECIPPNDPNYNQSCLDCAGIVNGDAVIDDCGECLPLNDPNYNQSCLDCAGTVNGDAVIDNCGECLPPSDPNFNQNCLDCAGTVNGDAIIDSCGECLPPSDPNFNKNCLDCAGTFNGDSVIDSCGECLPPSDPNFNATCLDCLGVLNGTTQPGESCQTGLPGECAPGTYNSTCECEPVTPESREICDGKDNDCDGEVDENFPQLGQECVSGVDECRVEGELVCDIDGDLTCNAVVNPADLEGCSDIIGCDGIPGSTLQFDDCGVCGGDSSSCDGCDSQDIFDVLLDLDGGAKAQEKLIRSITKRLKRSRRPKARAFSRNIRRTAHELQLANWILSWQIPQVITSCPAELTQCVTVSNVDKLEEYRGRSEELRDLGLAAARRLRRFRKKNRIARRWRKRVRVQHRINMREADKVPLETDVCN